MIQVFSGVGFPSSSQTVARYEWGVFDANGYFEALGLTPDCTFGEIKKAYRELVRKYHPDSRDEPDATKFREIKEIYAVLSDPVLRGEYSKIDPADGQFYMGVLEKEILNDLAQMRGVSPEDMVHTVKIQEKFFDYFSEKQNHNYAQQWYEYVLSAAYLYRYRGIIRIGLDAHRNEYVSNKSDYLVFWFDPSLPPNWISAFIAVSEIADFLWKYSNHS